NFSPEKGTSHMLDSGDSRLVHVVYKSGSLWTSHGVCLPGGPQGQHEAAQWWQITPPANIASQVAATQEGRVEDASGKVHYTYTSMNVNDAGDVLIGGSRFSSDSYPSAFEAFHGASDPASSTRPPYTY